MLMQKVSNGKDAQMSNSLAWGQGDYAGNTRDEYVPGNAPGRQGREREKMATTLQTFAAGKNRPDSKLNVPKQGEGKKGERAVACVAIIRRKYQITR